MKEHCVDFQKRFWRNSNQNCFLFMLTGILRVDGLQIDFEQLLLQLKKHEIVIKSFNNDWEYIENLKRQIGRLYYE